MQPSHIVNKFFFLLQWLVLELTIRLFRLVHINTASAFMGWAWRTFAPLNARHKRVLENLELIFPEKSAAEREEIAREMWTNLGRVAAETLLIDRIALNPRRFEEALDERTKAILEQGHGAVFVCMHSANWEVAVQPIIKRGHPVAGIYQELKNVYAERALHRIRVPLYPAGLYPKSRKTAGKLVHLLKEGKFVAIMADLKELRGVTVDFMGKPASATPAPASLARSINLPIVVARVIRTKGVRFRIEARTIDVPRTTDKAADILAGTQQIHDIFGEWIRERPGQWMWVSRKWAALWTKNPANPADDED